MVPPDLYAQSGGPSLLRGVVVQISQRANKKHFSLIHQLDKIVRATTVTTIHYIDDTIYSENGKFMITV